MMAKKLRAKKEKKTEMIQESNKHLKKAEWQRRVESAEEWAISFWLRFYIFLYAITTRHNISKEWIERNKMMENMWL